MLIKFIFKFVPSFKSLMVNNRSNFKVKNNFLTPKYQKEIIILSNT